MNIRKKIKDNEIILLDGSMGAVVMQMGYSPSDILKLNVTTPEVITNIHRGYLAAGCDIIITNSFDLRKSSAEKSGYDIEKLIESAVYNANKAKAEFDDKAVAFGLAPSGEKSYEGAYELYKYQIALAHSHADMIIAETLSTLSDAKAAYDACREVCDKPIFLSMSFRENEHTWFGTSLSEYIEFINSTDIDAAGINCTLTPKEMLPILKKLKQSTDKALFAEPNRGQPINTLSGISYPTSSEDYAKASAELVKNDIHIIGGCCGADSECMAKLNNLIR